MAQKFQGNTRARIRALQARLKQVQAGDTREKAQADAKGRVPLLFASTQAITTAMQTLLDRCTAALAVRA